MGLRRSADRVEGLVGLVRGRTACVSVSGRAALGARFWVRGLSFDAGMTRLGRGGAVFEAERPFVVGDQSGRDGFAGVGIGEAVHRPQIVDHAPGRGELDPCGCVVPALFRRSMPAALVL